MYMIGRLARKTRVKADSIRFYERQGLVSAESKTPAGYRLYGEAAVRRLLVIKHAQRCGFTLAEIGRLLNPRQATAASGAATHRMLSNKKMEMDTTIDALQAMSEALGSLLVAMDRSPEDTALAACLTDYAGEFVSGITAKNLVAVQFHPEKSQQAGLTLLKNAVAFLSAK